MSKGVILSKSCFVIIFFVSVSFLSLKNLYAAEQKNGNNFRSGTFSSGKNTSFPPSIKSKQNSTDIEATPHGIVPVPGIPNSLRTLQETNRAIYADIEQRRASGATLQALHLVESSQMLRWDGSQMNAVDAKTQQPISQVRLSHNQAAVQVLLSDSAKWSPPYNINGKEDIERLLYHNGANASVSILVSPVVKGSPEFTQKMEEALSLLEDKAPQEYQSIIQNYLGIIEEVSSHGEVGIISKGQTPIFFYKVQDSLSPTWDATNIAHDAFHSFRERNGLSNKESEVSTVAAAIAVDKRLSRLTSAQIEVYRNLLYKNSQKEELHAFDYQLKIARLIGAPAEEIDFIRNASGRHAEPRIDDFLRQLTSPSNE